MNDELSFPLCLALEFYPFTVMDIIGYNLSPRKANRRMAHIFESASKHCLRKGGSGACMYQCHISENPIV